jgi:O-antigen/teichoic acid export membrane protein
MALNRELIKGSILLMIVFNLASLVNFIFQSSMARMLSVAEYGVLGALSYFFYFFSIFSESVQTVVVKYTATLKDKGAIKNILFRTFKKSRNISLMLFMIFLVISIPFSYFLHISYYLLSLTGITIFTAFFLPATRGVIQGQKKFFSLGKNMLLESLTKLLLGILLIYAGWRVYGAIGATLLASFIALLFSFYSIKDIRKSEEKKTPALDIYSYSWPVLILTFSILAFYTADILIAKIVFSDEMAGQYAIASILSKIIFWGTQPISRAMFPISASEKKGDKEVSTSYLNALGLIFGCCVIALLVFGFFSDFTVHIFSGKHYLSSSSILVYLGIATSLLSMANLNILYKISQGHTKNSSIFLVFFIIGIALLFMFHKTLIEFSIAFIVSSALFLWGSLSILKK